MLQVYFKILFKLMILAWKENHKIIFLLILIPQTGDIKYILCTGDT